MLGRCIRGAWEVLGTEKSPNPPKPMELKLAVAFIAAIAAGPVSGGVSATYSGQAHSDSGQPHSDSGQPHSNRGIRDQRAATSE